MKFIKYNQAFFNYPSNLYSSDPKLTYIYWGNLLVDNLIGPTGSNAIDKSSKVSTLKSFNEAIERRALMAGGYSNERNEVEYYNLVTSEIGTISKKYTTYSIDKKFFSDTTGTASYYNSHDTIYKATNELLEKNCLFLFWYGLKGKKVILNFENKYLNMLMKEGYSVEIFEVDYLSPFITYITIIHNDKDLVYSTGISGGLNKTNCLLASIEEAYLLMWKNDFERIANPYNDFTLKHHIEFIDYLRDFSMKEISIKQCPNSNSKNNINLLVESLPSWIKELNVVRLNTTVKEANKVVLVFSRDLFNHIPLKRAIDLEKPINKETINLSEIDLKRIPECMII
ncbi:hypothetical protein NCCP2222_12910 [Sporosarcina sp. NCCP-2222]|uniref:hypothetical protein n=1 Tax=Sporosarcina sp. NCCP-2222 TaxID=2935073 RepID=UPI00208C5FB6|nr:hypothetical protein [Sporosarcina sp. NCCP-2222]GKV55344.1 hypothetical protein NCCP2222_12910 [Sporosarcina sp. NCCP-2222]